MIFGDNDFDAVGLLGILPQHLPDKKSLGLILSEFKPKQGTTVDGSEIPNNHSLDVYTLVNSGKRNYPYLDP